ncbi:MAG TPA: FlgD immunoglobulin-like domain containing protein [bacterium]|nr:FlgD immunoglobulin-like domain containing protein [bacterium]
MARPYRSDGSACGGRPTALLKLAVTVFAVVCIVGPAMGWMWDVSTKRIAVPAGNVDSGTVVVPSAVITNPGDSTATFPVLYTIGAFYTSTKTVTALAHGDSVTVTFDTWIAIQRGAQTAKCSTQLAADESTANDRATRAFTVRVRDVSVDSIMVPKGRINFGVAVTPQARVTNHGTSSANFYTKIYLGPFIAESSVVMGLASGASQTVNFPSWTPDSLGSFQARCTSMLANDMIAGNNLATDSFTVITLAKDAGALRIVAPPSNGIVDSGAVIAPQAEVRNFGTDTITFKAIFKIGATYTDTQQVTNLPSLESTLVTFKNWTASPLGTLMTRCSTALTGDSNATNDRHSDSVHVIIRTADVGALRFIAPPDTTDSGAVDTVKVQVYNYGLNAQSFSVKVLIGTLYGDTESVTGLASHETLQITCAKTYTVPRRGLIAAKCSTMLTGDQVTANDLATKNIFRRVRDVGANSISAPVGTVPFDTVVTPTAHLVNYGNTTDSFPVIFTIGTFYADTVRTNDTSALVTFKPCTLKTAGTFSTVCSTAHVGDVYPTNDAVHDSVIVTPPGIAGSNSSGIPRAVVLKTAGPSVFAGQASIVYGLPRNTQVRLEIFDVCGRPVQTLATGVGKPGYYNVVWHCDDARGRTVAEGAYFVRLTADGKTLTSKLVKLE